MNNSNLQDENAGSGSKAAREAYEWSLVPIIGIIPYIVFAFIALYNPERTNTNTIILLRKGMMRIGVVLLVLFLSLICLFLVIGWVSNNLHIQESYGDTKSNLEYMRFAISEYRKQTGVFPSPDLRELTTVRLQRGNRQDTLFPVVPSETISRKNRRNNLVYNQPNSQGGWYYNPKTGEVRVNFNRPLDDSWGEHAGEIPAEW